MMRHHTIFTRSGARRALALLVIAGALAWDGRADAEKVVIIVNAAGPLRARSDADIRDIFLGKIRVVADVTLQPVQLRGEIATTFLREVVGMSEREFQLYWMRKAYEDGRLPPPALGSTEEVLRFVAGQPGAIGFVDDRSISIGSSPGSSETAAPGVLVIREIDAGEGRSR